MKSKGNSLYIHIPFCRHICSYCDFVKFIYNQTRVDKYFQSLFFELEKLDNIEFKTVYIGGGTPSAIDLKNMEKLLSYLSLRLSKNYEFCIECNVEDLNVEKLSLFKKYKINRLSIGVQTFNEKYINMCNRHHNKEMVFNNINLAKKYIENISIDMIFAFPHQSIEELKSDLDLVLKLPITHISYYSLLVEPNTIFYAKKIANMDDDLQEKMYRIINTTLSHNGLHRYEISSWSKKGYQSKHNLVYWRNQNYYAVGLNASGYINNIRFTNTSNIIDYLDKKIAHKEEIILTPQDVKFEQIMLSLRLDEGINIAEFNKKFNTSIEDEYKNQLEYLYSLKLIKINKNNIKCTLKGSLILNDVIEMFLDK